MRDCTTRNNEISTFGSRLDTADLNESASSRSYGFVRRQQTGTDPPRRFTLKPPYQPGKAARVERSYIRPWPQRLENLAVTGRMCIGCASPAPAGICS